jgi:hypothetical protein
MQEINRSVSDTHPVSAALSCRIPFDRRQLSSSSKTLEQGPSRSLSGTAGAAAGAGAGAGAAGKRDESMMVITTMPSKEIGFRLYVNRRRDVSKRECLFLDRSQTEAKITSRVDDELRRSG